MKIQFLALMMISAIIMSGQVAQGAVIDVPYTYPTIKAALFNSVHGDQVRIAAGHYHEIELQIPPGVTLSGTGQRPADVVIDGQGEGRIMLCESLDSTTIIQNITFINGAANGESVYDQSGGAILLNNSNPRIINCVFRNNLANGHGGAIRFTHASPQILNCFFESNSAPHGGGGAIDCSYDSNPLVQGCFFKNNSAQWGGGMSCRGNSAPMVFNSQFDRNQVSGDLGYGGAVMADTEAMPLFQQCTFYGNSGRYGGALASFADSKTNLVSCTLVGNSSEWLGAGLLCIDSFPTIENTIIAFQEGSAVACAGSALPLISCSNIYGNDRGDWTGTIAAQATVEGNLSRDPLFCNPDPDLDFQFRLRIDSPCADLGPDCVLMGAWPAGCEITPIFIDEFDAVWENGQPRLTWHSAGQRSAEEYVLVCGADTDPALDRVVPHREESNGQYWAVDGFLTPLAGEEYTYSLFVNDILGGMTLISQAHLKAADQLPPLRLVGVQPNPFNPRTTISFEISQERTVDVSVHDIKGRLVRNLARSRFDSGTHELVWDGMDDNGRRLESGTFFVTLRSENLVRSQKVLLLK